MQALSGREQEQVSMGKGRKVEGAQVVGGKLLGATGGEVRHLSVPATCLPTACYPANAFPVSSIRGGNLRQLSTI